MRVTLTRGSVCMGDDTDAPHEVEWECDDAATIHDLLHRAVEGYCPRMEGGCWIAYSGRTRVGTKPLAVIYHRWPQPRILPGADPARLLESHAEGVELFFEYRCPVEPEALWRQMAGEHPAASGLTTS